ncbi:Pectate lyase superfamily protein [Pseudobutyrivibrio sp. OR37]|uniref:glycosyl hydrolase family 28-related protein n=1 Tax=Pseudobutyrivibrio sp. OR37 TaxID=1798186 RepID=UPI0008EEC3A1|nr:glycosyl hydrolase family 28-related protein [Pseudobutyrivibrio sp. OR37]SFH96156.1 Pectate lyase superfamily protein [Pseudobutyrivibrio sp. OR37]
MNIKEYFTYKKIIQSFLVIMLGVFCYAFAGNFVSIDDDIIPLSSGNIEAMFYVENAETGTMTCIGDGLINTASELYGNDSVVKAIVTSPDYTNYLSQGISLSWNKIIFQDNHYKVIGTSVSKNTSPSQINVCDYGMIGDGHFDNSAIFKELCTKYKNLYFPSGQYLFTSEITISNALTMTGESFDSSVLIFNCSSIPPNINWNFRLKCKNFNASNLSFKLSDNIAYDQKTNIGSALIKIDTSDSCSFNRCSFECDNSSPYYYTTFWINSDNGPISNILLSNCEIKNTAACRIGGAFWVYGCKYPISNVKAINCSFFHTGWDENIAIWGRSSVDITNISITNCVINNANNDMVSDNIIAVNLRSPISTVNVENNAITGNGHINTGIKLLGAGNIVFSNNTTNITNLLDDKTNYGYLYIFDCYNLTFSNNTTVLTQAFPARIKLKSSKNINSNNFTINAESLRFEYTDKSTASSKIVLNDNNFNLDVDILDFCTFLYIDGGTISFNSKTRVFLPTYNISSSINNCTIDGDISIIFDNHNKNLLEISNSIVPKTIKSNYPSKLIIN